jgi:hypothetical protein
MNFGQAIEALKEGKTVARAGWNGKGMHLYLNKGVVYDRDLYNIYRDGEIVGHEFSTATVGGVSTELFEPGGEGVITRMPNINMRAADGSIVTGWLASQTDILAEDWVVDAAEAHRRADQLAAAGPIHGAITPLGFKDVEGKMRAIVADELRKQMKPANILTRRVQ